MQIEKIKDLLNKIIENDAIIIYSMKTKREFGEWFLEILLEGKFDTNKLENIHTQLYEQLTEDIFDFNYYLELSSVGAERPIETKEQMMQAIGSYIYLTSPIYQGNGTLISFDDDVLVLEVNMKGQFKKIKIKYEEQKNCRTAVKV